jgi:predicted AlkP superfamily pyrophosphatase or phosphodiesterase
VLKHAGIEGAWVISEGGTAMVYVLDPANRAALVPKLKDVFKNVEGVERVFDSSDFPGMGFPDPAKYDQMADLVLAAKPDYSFSGATAGNPVIDVPPGTTPGAHGYVATDPDMEAIFIAWGYGIRQGARVERVRSVDIAPTIARLLGVDLGKVEGQPIGAILK